MGDYLHFVNLDLTVAPTSIPTMTPSVSPTDPICDVDAMYEVNWHNLLNEDEEESALLHEYIVDFDASTMSLTVSASVEYVGLSADGNFDDDFNLGTTYWIDFQSFSGSDGGVDSAGSCANRQSTDYDELQFADYWSFTVNPMDLESVSTAERMAYPPSDWTLNASSCNMVEYERTFSWSELTSYTDAGGSALITVS